MKSIFTEEQIKYIKENYRNMSYRDIGKHLGFTERQIRGKVNNMGLTKLRKINVDYFSIIDSPIKAYFIGFLFADGWVIYNEQNRNYELAMELQSGDKYILDRLDKELGGGNTMYHKIPKEKIINGVKTMSGHIDGIRIFSKKIVSDLINHGIVQNKTNHDVFPIVEEKYFFDFLRGYIDGDGCFYCKDNSVTMHITCSSNKPLKYIKEVLLRYDIPCSLYKEKEKKYRLVCQKREYIIKMLNRLYYKGDLFCLKRKFDKIKFLLEGGLAA